MKKLNFIDFTAAMAFVFAVWDLGFYMKNGDSPAFLLKGSITFLCMNLLLTQLKNK